MPETVIVAAMTNITTDAFENPKSKTEEFAIEDLLEVEACLREQLQSASDPAVQQRLLNLHREIEKYIAELKPAPRKTGV